MEGVKKLWSEYFQVQKNVVSQKLLVLKNCHIVPVAILEYFKALKFSKLEIFRALKPYGQIRGF